MASAGKRLAQLLGERSPGIWDTGNTAAWRRGLIDSPYTRLGTRRANEVGGARVEYRQLRVREIERIQLLAKRLSERSGGAISQAQASARLLAPGCALVDCAAEFSDANPARAYYQKLAGHAEPSTKALLVKQKYTYKGNQRPLFTYTLDEKLVDGWSRYQVGTRALGGMETVGGVLGVGAGLGLGGVSCETGVGCVAAAGLMTYSADHAYAGARTLWSGRPTPTLLQDAMVAVGVPLKVVPYLDGALGILTGVGTLSPATLRLPLKEIGAEEISQTGRALVHGEGGTVRAATQDGAARLKAPYPAELKSVGADVTRSAGTGFRGSKGFELKNAPFQKVRNSPTTINGRDFSGHALDQMQNRGIMPSVVENTLKTGASFPTRAGASRVFDPVNKIRVITNSETGRVVTVIRGAPK